MGKKGRKGGKKGKELPPPPPDDEYEDFVPASVLQEDSDEEEKVSASQQREEEEAAAKAKSEEIRAKKNLQKKLKKQKKEQQEKQRQEEVMKARLNAPNPRKIESDRILKQVRPLGLSIHENFAQEDLRMKAAEMMRASPDDFIPFLDDYEGSAEDHFQQVCSLVEKSGEWGGEMEIMALSRALQRPITVYSAIDEPRTFGEQFNGAPLLLSYHKQYYSLGAHYNSLLSE